MFNVQWLEYIKQNDVTPKVDYEGHGLYTGDAAIVYDYEASDYLNKDIYRVVEGFHYVCNDGTVVVVPTGYLTDGASIPKLFRGFINPWGRHARASIVHDILCDFGTAYDPDLKPVPVTDDELNDIFLEAMDTDTVSHLKKKIIITAVRFYFRFLRGKRPTKDPIDIKKLESLYENRA